MYDIKGNDFFEYVTFRQGLEEEENEVLNTQREFDVKF